LEEPAGIDDARGNAEALLAMKAMALKIAL
jgi:hypothetical protein